MSEEQQYPLFPDATFVVVKTANVVLGWPISKEHKSKVPTSMAVCALCGTAVVAPTVLITRAPLAPIVCTDCAGMG